MTDKLGGRKFILVLGLIILNFYLVATHNPDAIAFMTFSTGIASIYGGLNMLGKVADNMKSEPTIKVTQTETPTMTKTIAETPISENTNDNGQHN